MKPLRLLIVEDSDDDAELVLLELQRCGYEVEHERVDTEADLRSALDRGPWDIVLSDFSMPQFSGSAALALVRGSGHDIPFIIVSGTVGEEAAVAAMRSGANDYVLKGNLARLCPAIEREVREFVGRSEQRKLEEQLLISDRMASVGVLAAGVAHEINNPLAAIVANLELMASELSNVAGELGLNDRLSEVFAELRDARESSDRVRHIVSDLKIFSRSSDDGPRGKIDVNRVMDSALRMAKTEIRHRAKLVKQYGDVPPVDANEARLGQVFLNLIVNAAHAIREGNAEHNAITVVTHADATSGRVLVEVQDTGSGIAPEDLPRIFDAFFTTKPVGVGTGLGLSICHRIISGLGGHIEVQSQVGAGTVFRVFLPAARGKSFPAPAMARVAPAARRGNVLLVDDDAAVARAIVRMLESEHAVTVSSNGADALGRVRGGERFDLILCDLMMPQMTGMELHEQLSRMAPEQADRLVFVTGGAFTPEARAFLDRAPNERIEKPFDRQQLRAIINRRIT